MTTSGDHKDLLIMLHKKVHDKQVWVFLFPRTRQAQLGGVQGYGGTVLCGAAEIITLESKGRLCHFKTWHIRPFGTKVARYSDIIKHFRLCIYITEMYCNRKNYVFDIFCTDLHYNKNRQIVHKKLLLPFKALCLEVERC